MELSLLLLSHWIGDFVLQTSKMALGKSSSLKWLTLHVLTYTGVLLVFAMFLFQWETALIFCAINFLLHWTTDFFTSKVTNKYRHMPRVFFPLLGFDQMIHGICLILTFQWFS